MWGRWEGRRTGVQWERRWKRQGMEGERKSEKACKHQAGLSLLNQRGIYTLWFCNSVLHTSKTLLQRPISIHAAIHIAGPTPAWETETRFLAWRSSWGHNAWEEDKRRRLLSMAKLHAVVINTPTALHVIIKKKNLGTLSLNEVWSDTLWEAPSCRHVEAWMDSQF